MTPGSPEWRRLITASKVAAILGLSPWESPRSLWHTMRGELPTDDGNDYTRRGHYLEPAILAWWRDQHGITDTKFLDQWRDQPTYTLGDWAAATPDAAVMLGTEGESDWHRVLVEAKSTAQDWDELPPYYLAQVIWQMHVSGIHRCYVPVIGPRLTFTEHVVDYADYAEDAALIETQARAFYDSLTADEPPDLDDTVATYDAVRKLHPDIDRGESVELTAEEARRLVEWCDELKSTEKAARLARATVYDRMGRAQYATHNGRRIARRQAAKYGVSLVVTAKPGDLPERDIA